MRRVTFAQRRCRVVAFSASDLLSVVASIGLLAVLMLAAVAQSRLSSPPQNLISASFHAATGRS